MSDEEAIQFASHPLFDLYIKLRRWDEMAKIEGYEVPSLQKYRKMIIEHLSKK